MGFLPICLNFRNRFQVDTFNRVVEEVSPTLTPAWEAALLMTPSVQVKPLSDIAKFADSEWKNSYGRKLPPQDEMNAALILAHADDPDNVIRRNRADIPFKLKAVGFINVHQILTRTGPRLVSNDFEIVP